jgi:hypothetical protein
MGGPGGARFVLEMEPDAKNIDMAFSKWANLMDNWGPAFADVVRLFQMHERQHFETEGRSTGRKFRRLSKPYKKWKDKNARGKPILVLRGTMRRALVTGGRGTDGIRKIGKFSLAVGIDPDTRTAKYARAHSEGKRKGGRMPKRPPVRYDPTPFSPDLNRVGKIGGRVPFGSAVAQMFQVYIVKKRKQAHADELFADSYDWRKMRRGVIALGKRTK